MNSRLPVVTQEIQIVDSQGNVRILLSTKAGAPAIQLLQADGRPGAEVLLNADGRPAVKLTRRDRLPSWRSMTRARISSLTALGARRAISF
jgi:hypothetical protein